MGDTKNERGRLIEAPTYNDKTDDEDTGANTPCTGDSCANSPVRSISSASSLDGFVESSREISLHNVSLNDVALTDFDDLPHSGNITIIDYNPPLLSIGVCIRRPSPAAAVQSLPSQVESSLSTPCKYGNASDSNSTRLYISPLHNTRHTQRGANPIWRNGDSNILWIKLSDITRDCGEGEQIDIIVSGDSSCDFFGERIALHLGDMKENTERGGNGKRGSSEVIRGDIYEGQMLGHCCLSKPTNDSNNENHILEVVLIKNRYSSSGDDNEMMSVIPLDLQDTASSNSLSPSLLTLKLDGEGGVFGQVSLLQSISPMPNLSDTDLDLGSQLGMGMGTGLGMNDTVGQKAYVIKPLYHPEPSLVCPSTPPRHYPVARSISFTEDNDKSIGPLSLKVMSKLLLYILIFSMFIGTSIIGITHLSSHLRNDPSFGITNGPMIRCVDTVDKKCIATYNEQATVTDVKLRESGLLKLRKRDRKMEGEWVAGQREGLVQITDKKTTDEQGAPLHFDSRGRVQRNGNIDISLKKALSNLRSHFSLTIKQTKELIFRLSLQPRKMFQLLVLQLTKFSHAFLSPSISLERTV
jgi:hypothetical protein